jgi:leukotriene-A4 hydrolase
MLKRSALALLTVVAYANADIIVVPNPNDPSSYSNTKDIVTTSFHLDLTVDFTKSVITGSNTLTLDVMNPTTQLVLDIMSINVTKAYLLGDKDAKTELKFTTQTPNPNLGQVLIIEFNEALIQGTKGVKVMIEYSTGPKATALNWMTKEQTATKVQPYLFT